MNKLTNYSFKQWKDLNNTKKVVNINQKSGIMITKKQLKIFRIFIEKPFKERSIKEIKEESKQKSNNFLTLALKQFKKDELIIERIIGKSKLYTLNLNNEEVYSYFSLNNTNKLNKLTKTTLTNIKKSIEKHTKFYSLLIFGSYAIQKQTKNSDLDIAVIIETKKTKNKIELSLDQEMIKSIIKIDFHIITNKELLLMLKDEKENLGKQIVKKHLSVTNHKIFYDIIQDGIKNGFRI